MPKLLWLACMESVNVPFGKNFKGSCRAMLNTIVKSGFITLGTSVKLSTRSATHRQTHVERKWYLRSLGRDTK